MPPEAQRIKEGDTILLVDDEEIILDLNRDLFKNLGYSIYTATSGSEALNIYSEKRTEIDLIIMDMIMPANARPGTLREN